ncbi:pilus assembly FimT family protein [Chitinimonas naiadis]
MSRLRLATRRSAAGFSLLELMVVVVIIGVLTAIGVPSYRTWVENSKIRTLTDSLQDGLRYARAEAIRRNTPVRFQLTSTLNASCALGSTSTNWVVSLANPAGLCDVAVSDTTAPRTLKKSLVQQTNGATSNLSMVSVLANGTPAAATATTINTITFNPYGRVNEQVQAGVWMTISNSTLTSTDLHPLRITVTQNGQIRRCDPSTTLATDDPRRC